MFFLKFVKPVLRQSVFYQNSHDFSKYLFIIVTERTKVVTREGKDVDIKAINVFITKLQLDLKIADMLSTTGEHELTFEDFCKENAIKDNRTIKKYKQNLTDNPFVTLQEENSADEEKVIITYSKNNLEKFLLKMSAFVEDYHNQNFDATEDNLSSKNDVSQSESAENIEDTTECEDAPEKESPLSAPKMEQIDKDMIDSILHRLEKPIEICITGIQTSDKNIGELAENPGVYNFTAPSFFVEPAGSNFTKENQTRENYNKTKHGLKDLLYLFNKLNKDKSKTATQKNSTFLQERSLKIREIIDSKTLTNAQKYLRYMLITPGLPDDYMYTLDAAERNNIDADIVIQLLEQPQEAFNRKLLEHYVSSANKNNTYDLKAELIQQLLDGTWVVKDKDGYDCKLVPYGKIIDVKNELIAALQGNQDNDNSEEESSQEEIKLSSECKDENEEENMNENVKEEAAESEENEEDDDEVSWDNI